MIEKINFYKYQLLICLSINLLIYFSMGTYYEEYESIINNFVHGTFQYSCTNDWLVDTHFILLALYAKLNTLFKTTQVYGWVLTLLNNLSLLYFGSVLYRLLKINLKKCNIYFFLFFYIILSANYIVQLGSTKIVLLLSISNFGYLLSVYLERKKIEISTLIIVILSIILCSLIRVESTLMIGLLVSIFCIYHRQFQKTYLLLSIIPFIVFVFFKLTTNKLSSDAWKTYYNYEYQFIDKENINYEQLNDKTLYEVNMFKQYQITDSMHFSATFYESIAYSNYNDILKQNYVSIKKSFYPILNNYWYILMTIISCLLLLIIYKFSTYWIIHCIFCLLFPFVLSTILVVPDRFIIFYYTLIALCNLLLYLNQRKLNTSIVIGAIVLLVIFIMNINNIAHKNKIKNIKINNNINYLTEIQKQYGNNDKIILNRPEYLGDFFILNPLQKLNRQNALYLNFWFFESYNCYLNSWKNYCDCNPLSLNDKVNFIVTKQLKIISDETSIQKVVYYLNKYQNNNLELIKYRKYDDTHNIYTIKYNHP